MRLFTSFTVKERLSCTTMRHEYCWDLQWAYCSKMFVQSKLTRADLFFLNWLPGVDITHSFNYQCLIVSNTPRNLIGHIFTPSSWLFFDAMKAVTHPALSPPCCLGLPFVLLTAMRLFLSPDPESRRQPRISVFPFPAITSPIWVLAPPFS